MASRRKIILISILMFGLLSSAKSQWQDQSMKRAEEQTRFLIQQMSDSIKLPRTFCKKSGLVYTSANDWTSGFFPGVLWLLYNLTNDPYWSEQAKKNTSKLFPIQYFTKDHDIGFMIMCSYGLGYKLNADKTYKNVIINSARSLSTRYCAKAGTIQSWDSRISRTGVKWDCPVIIDNMMNLELLFEATKLSGDSSFRKIAIQHANTTIKNHIRPDFSTFHLVNYDKTTGAVTDRDTWQGFARNSTWARGQAWAVYGFVMCYRETGDKKYLDIACNLADFYLKNLPQDKIPIWDFNVNDKNLKPDWNYTAKIIEKSARDASAAAIVTSALFELSTFSPALYTKYFNVAKLTLQSLSCKNYLAEKESNGGFILKHSVGNMPRGLDIDVPLNYTDYYYLEALLRYDKIQKNKQDITQSN